jgi:hypothetical protein
MIIYLIGAVVSQRLRDLCKQLNAEVYFRVNQFDWDQHRNVAKACRKIKQS